MKIKILSYTVLLTIVIAGCKIVDPVENTPTYLSLDSFYVETTDPAKTGSTSSRIDLAWVYFEGEPVGVFDIPSKIPVLAGRTGRLTVVPGVLVGGLSSQQIIYPFYLGDTFTIDPAPGQIIKHIGKTRYVPDAKFVWKEDFENGNSFAKYDVTNLADTTIIRFADDSRVIEGKASGIIMLNADNTPTAESIINQGFALGTNNSFLEIDYKSSAPFEIGLQDINNAANYMYIAGALPHAEKNKFYVNLQNAIGTMQAKSYKVIIRAKLSEGQSEGYVIIDNVKAISL